jgi:hypothetical protein
MLNKSLVKYLNLPLFHKIKTKQIITTKNQ